MKTLTNQRRLKLAKGTYGEFTLDSAPGLRWTVVEPGTAGDHPCIPAAEYVLELGMYNHGGYPAYEVKNVPGRDEIKIHAAQVPTELLGCQAPGHGYSWTDTPLGRMLGNSYPARKAFDDLMAALGGDQQVRYIILDPAL